MQSINAVTLHDLDNGDRALFSSDSHSKHMHADSMSISMHKHGGWVEFGKHSGQWILNAYQGKYPERANPLFADEIDQRWLDQKIQQDKLTQEKQRLLLKSLGWSESPGEPTFDVAYALEYVRAWIYENIAAANIRLRFSNLLQKIPGLIINYAGGMMPFQAEGTLEGFPFYFRYRGGNMTLRIGSAESPDDLWFKPLYMSSKNHGGMYGGELSDEEFEYHFFDLVKALERSPIFWSFEGTFTQTRGIDKEGEVSEMGAWALTAEEAWEKVHDIRGREPVTPERWQALIDVSNLNPTTVTIDDRPFPAVAPQFLGE